MLIWRRARGPLILTLLVVAVFWKLLTTQFTWLDQPDMARQVMPWYQAQAASWQSGEFPLWDPHVFGGQPVMGQMQPGAAYPLNWPLFLWPLKNGQITQRSLHVYFIFTHILAGLFCYWLCRDLGRSAPAAILGGLAFSVTGVIGSLGWPQMLNGAIWLPLIVMFFLRAARGERSLSNAAISGALLAVSLLSGHHQIPIFIGLLMSGLWIYELWRQRRRLVLPLMAFGLAVVLVSAFQTLPAIEYGMRSIRWVGTHNAVFWGQSVPYLAHQHASLRPMGLLGFILPMDTNEAFVGLTLLTLACIGTAAAIRERPVRTMSFVFAGGVLLALGGYSLFHGVVYLIVPMVEKARTPLMALVVSHFAIAVLAARGMDALSAVLPTVWSRLLLVIGFLPWPFLAVAPFFRPEASLEYERLAVLGVVALALGFLLRTSRVIVALFFLLALFEIGTVIGGSYHHKENPGGYLAELERDRDVAEFLKKQADFTRLEVDTESVPYNIGDWYGLDQFEAYLGGLTSNIAQLHEDRKQGGHVARQLFALNYYVSRKPANGEQQEVFRGASGTNVYKNPEALPRAWTIHEAASASRQDLVKRLQSIDLRKQALFLGPARQLESCAGADQVRVVDRRATQMTLQAEMACRGLVVVSQTFYPGWKATVDGQAAEILETNGVLQGVIVGAGSHKLEFRYRPKSVYWGALLSLCGLLLVAGLRLRRDQTAPE